MTEPKKRGPKPRGITQTHGIRCTIAGWNALKRRASNHGFKSVGEWADALGALAQQKNA